MPLYRPSELRSYLESIGAFPKKGLSQNFLVDGNILKKIVNLAELCSFDHVIEIGPGPGALTEQLLLTGSHVIAIEKDTLLADGLKKTYIANSQLRVLNEDVLDVDFAVLHNTMPSQSKIKIIANIPYNITSLILHKIVQYSDMINLCVLMVQEEVARKCVAQPGMPEYGFLSVFLQLYSTPQYGFHVPAGCFYPRPKVGSSVIRLDMQKKFTTINEQAFIEVLKVAFTHKRKMIKASLKELFDPSLVERSLENMKLRPTARPDELFCHQWIDLYQKISC